MNVTIEEYVRQRLACVGSRVKVTSHFRASHSDIRFSASCLNIIFQSISSKSLHHHGVLDVTRVRPFPVKTHPIFFQVSRRDDSTTTASVGYSTKYVNTNTPTQTFGRINSTVSNEMRMAPMTPPPTTTAAAASMCCTNENDIFGEYRGKALPLTHTIFIIIITSQHPYASFNGNLFTENDFDSIRLNHRHWFYTLKYSWEWIRFRMKTKRWNVCWWRTENLSIPFSHYSQWLVLAWLGYNKKIIKYTMHSGPVLCNVFHLLRCILMGYSCGSIWHRSANVYYHLLSQFISPLIRNRIFKSI